MVELTDSQGEPFAFFAYDACGTPTATQSRATGALDAQAASVIAGASVLRYASYCYDEHSGLYYLSQRYYDPATASFITKDPAKADGEESAYQYCGGDPVGKVDPSGEIALAPVLVGAGFVVVIAVVVASPYAAGFGRALSRVWASSSGWYKRYLGTQLAVLGVVAFSLLPKGSKLSASSVWRTPGTHPGDFTKLRGAQGWRHGKTGETWKGDKKHKNHAPHWDVSNAKGQKVREVDGKGKQLWPRGPKNKNKK